MKALRAPRLAALCLAVLAAALAAVLPLAPAAAQDGKEWWVIVGFVDHPPMQWDDAVLAKGNLLNARLADCGLSAFWDFTGKFDGLATKRGSVFVVATNVMLTKKAATAILAATKPCVGDAYIKEARYFGE